MESIELKEVEIKLFPNPTKNLSILEINSKYENLELTIMNNENNILYHKTYNENISLISLSFISMWAKGKYIVQIKLDAFYFRELLLIKE